MEPTVVIPLTQVELIPDPHDKEELCDHASLISMPQLLNDHVISIFANNSCVANKHVHHIANEQEEVNLLSSLSTLGYIEFDVLCNLDRLEAKLYGVSGLPWSSRNTFRAIGKYNSKGEYLVHKLYICSDMRLPSWCPNAIN